MAVSVRAAVSCLSVGALAAGCASRPTTTASALGGVGVFQSAGDMANSTARAGWDSMGQAYSGMGGAVRAPFQDFGMMNKVIPPVLARARANPYETVGLTSCEAVLDEVSELDAVLGPDLDNSESKSHANRYTAGADMAADAAVDAAKGAVDHFIPIRGVIRKLSGADRTQAKHAKSELAGSIRRGFLKSVGMAHNCSWPAAPMGFEPAPGGPVWPKLVYAKASALAASHLAAADRATFDTSAQPRPPALPPLQQLALTNVRVATPVPAYEAPTLSTPSTGAWQIGRAPPAQPATAFSH